MLSRMIQLDINLIVQSVVHMFKIIPDLKSANVSRTIRFTESMFEELNIIAQRNHISFNNLVLQCCRYAIEHLDDESMQNAHDT